MALAHENEELKAQLSQSDQDLQTMKTLLQAAQQQITNDQALLAQ